MSDTQAAPTPLTADERDRLVELRNSDRDTNDGDAELKALAAREYLPEHPSPLTETPVTAVTSREPLSDAEKGRLAELRAKNGGAMLSSAEAEEMQALAMREYANTPTTGELVPRGPSPLTDAERARLAELRAKPRMNDAEYEESLPLIEREHIMPPGGVVAQAATDFHARLNAGINEPPPAAPEPTEPAVPQHAMFAHLFAGIEQMLGAFGHLAVTVPQAAGLAPIITSATQRIQAARAAFADGMAAYGDVRRGDWQGAQRDGEQAYRDGRTAVTGNVSNAGTAGQPWPSEPQV